MNTKAYKWRRLGPSLPARGIAAGRALRSAWRELGLSSILCLLAGCNILPQPQADPVRHFTLTSPAGVMDGATVRPAQLAGHLRGRELAIRVAPGEVIYIEDARWAESLDDAITQLLRARIGSTGAGSVVTVQIQRCELVRNEGNGVQLAATYSILTPDGKTKRGAFTSSPRTWTGGDYGVLVGQIREAINEFGDALAAAVGGK